MRNQNRHFAGIASPIALVFTVALLAYSSQAHAQTLVMTSEAITYTELSSPTTIVTTADDGELAFTPPFPICFYGTDYTTMTISENGPIVFPSASSVSFSNTPLGDTGTPNNFVAAWWDDLRLYPENNGHIAHQTLGTAPNRTLTIEFKNMSEWGNSASTYSFQMRFFEGQCRVEVDYGAAAGAPSMSGTAGMEDSAGGNTVIFPPSGCNGSCSLTDFNGLTNTRISVALQDPELSGSFGTFPRGGFPGTQITGDFNVTNGGLNAATNLLVHYYLSANQTIEGSDALVASSTVANAPTGATTVQVDLTVPVNLPDGDYFLIAEVDSSNAYAEVNENNNVIVGPMLATEYEVQPTALSTMQPGINPGQTAVFDLEVTNNGVPLAGSLEVTLYASQDGVYDANDPLIGMDTVTLTGANVETVQVSGTLPQLPPGDYYAVAVVDPNNLLVESNEANNTIVSAGTFQTGPDFGVASVVIPAYVQPGASAQLATTISSLSVPFTGDVAYRLYASVDQTQDAMDTLLGSYMATFAGEASVTDTENVTFAAAIPPNAYYVIAVVDYNNAVTEVDEMNNSGASATTIINGPDFSISAAAFSPTTFEAGDMVSVTGTLNSNGVPFTGNIPVGVFLSPDDMFDPGDTLIHADVVFVGGVTSAAIDFDFGLAPVTPGTYTLFLVADHSNMVAEALETNNADDAAGGFAVQGADLRVETISGDPVAFIGRTYQVELTVSNTGIADARGFRYAYYLSEDESIRIFDTQIHVSQTATITAGGQQTFTDTITMPTLTSTQSLWLGVILDIYDQVPETNVPNNISRIRQALRIVFPIPDLEGQIVETATAGAAGEQFAITRQIVNSGVADAMSFGYKYYLSTNAQISTDDREIGAFNLALAEGADDYGIDVLTLPSNIPEGTYYVGMIVDPDNTIEEVSDMNNGALGPQIPIYRAAIQFITDNLPRGTLGVPYEVGIYARGGPLALTWSVQSGALPDGLSIDANSGIINGTPTTEGPFDFVLRASSGTAYADKSFSIRVTAPTVELEIATPSLPSAIAGRPYETTLIGVGGNPPYEWEAISDLPEGLELSADGRLFGVPTTPGNLPMTVSVRDAVNNSDSKALVLSVLNANQSVQITQVPLPDAVVGLPYCDPENIVFEAQNGVPPYSWSLIGEPPPGMTLNAMGELCGVPEQAGEYPLTVRAQDATGLFDTALFLLGVNGGNQLAITTFSLPGGMVDEDYSQKLTSARGMDPLSWSLVEGGGALPPGLELTSDGTVVGTPSAEGTYAFIVQVTDGQLRVDTQPLSIAIAPAPIAEEDDGGCGCAAAETERGSPLASLGILLLIGAFLFTRRR